jgi:hypothetical protein
MELPVWSKKFDTYWDGLIQSANRWITSPEFEGLAARLLRERLAGKTGRRSSLNRSFKIDESTPWMV